MAAPRWAPPGPRPGGSGDAPRAAPGRRPGWAVRIAVLGLLAVAVVAGEAWWSAREPTVEVVAHFPAAGAGDVPSTARVDVVLSHPVADQVDQLRLVLRDRGGRDVPAAVHVDPARRAAELEPVEALAPGEYTAVVAVPGVLDPVEWTFTVPARDVPTRGPGGPILLVLDPDDRYDDFLAEILRAEGYPSFTTVELPDLEASALAEHQVALVSGDPGPRASAALGRWVAGGGDAVLFTPGGDLARLAGLGPGTSAVRHGALEVDSGLGAGDQPVGVPLRLHARASGEVASDDVEVVGRVGSVPGVTVREVGPAGGTVAAFTFDLARSVVLTRQGNPAWVGEERDGIAPIRSNDLFYGARQDDPRPDWVDLDSVEVPHAYELMRVLSTLLARVTASTRPLPRWWYFPDDAEAVLVVAADDHATESGTADFFERMLAGDSAGCDVARWECARATSWLYPESGMTAERADRLSRQGFDLGAHVTTHCQNWSRKSLDLAFTDGLRRFRERFPGLPAQRGSRLHCIVWSDPVTQPRIGRAHGVRFDMNYYYWPREWVRGREGFMTGSGMPMRFSDLDGGLIDVYQQETHLVDEVFADGAEAVRGLVSRARGPEGYYGAFGTHLDFTDDFGDQLLAVGRELDVPLVSADQMLDWVDGRNASTVEDVAWDEAGMRFSVRADERTAGMLRGMLPVRALGGELTSIRRAGRPAQHEVRVVKGVAYAVFDATPGRYRASWSS
ncbi:Ig-like domain-containing protein [Nocardioides campestrisoli]|uniref:Ig-like domain-containing protein n=1 Tax=Nocardioides campestrisoli TaxID=2736757 RepID=UPI00163DB5BC|nr:Ig-like domain-containing protein [Nocardioides campestrisoli]